MEKGEAEEKEQAYSAPLDYGEDYPSALMAGIIGFAVCVIVVRFIGSRISDGSDSSGRTNDQITGEQMTKSQERKGGLPAAALAPTGVILITLLFVTTVALLITPTALLAAGIAAVSGLLLSRPSFRTFARRFCAALPFIAFASFSAYFSDFSVERSALMALRISASVTALITLTMVLPFHRLLAALQRLHMPRLLVLMLLFTHRYIFVFSHELDRMRTARRARGFTGGRHVLDRRGMHTMSATAGMIFVRALGRGTNVSQALRMRGFHGEIRMPLGAGREKWSAADYGTFAAVLVGCAVLLLIDLGVCVQFPEILS